MAPLHCTYFLKLAVIPCGTALGMFYLFGVTTLVAGGREETVPITYGAATLSSVLGSAWRRPC
jgi:hypothetical protein